MNQSISVRVNDLIASFNVERAKNSHGVHDKRKRSDGKLLQKLLEGLRRGEIGGDFGEFDGHTSDEKEKSWKNVFVDELVFEVKRLGRSESFGDRDERREIIGSFGRVFGEEVLKEEKEEGPFRGEEGRRLREKTSKKGEKGSEEGHFARKAHRNRFDLAIVQMVE